MQFIPVMTKLNFKHQLLLSSVSIILQKSFWYADIVIINVQNECLCKLQYICFSGFFDEQKIQKNSIYLKPFSTL